MTQEDVRSLLDSLGGEATRSELSELARKQHPNRTLHSYITHLLKAMEKKGYVEQVECESVFWRLTQRGQNERIGGYELDEIDEIISHEELKKSGFTISNIVGSFEIGRPLDLTALSSDLPNAEYHPESNSSMVYRIKEGTNITILVHTSGRQSITGAQKKSELRKARDIFLSELDCIGVEIKNTDVDILVQNIVSTYNFDREFDLAAVSTGLGLENIEYEPEQFPGLIYRTKVGATVLIFSSGKCVITGSKTYLQVQDALREIEEKLTGICI